MKLIKERRGRASEKSERTPWEVAERADQVESLEDLLLERHLAAEQADEDLAVLADPGDGRDAGGFEPGSADEEVVREFHRAIIYPRSGSLSGRRLSRNGR